MTKKICVLLRDDFLIAALSSFVTPKTRYLTEETVELFAEIRRRINGNEPYPAKYLFGWKQHNGIHDGLIQNYFDAGYDIEICASYDASAIVSENPSDCDAFDIHFSDADQTSVIAVITKGKDVFGWTPREFASKSFQMLFLGDNALSGALLPRSLVIPSGVSPQSHFFERFTDFFRSEYLIVKSAFGSATRFDSTCEYAVFPARLFGPWILKLAELAEKEIKQDLIISELIITDDPYAGCAENVVHKINCCSHPDGTDRKSLLLPTDNCCKKIACRLDLNRVGNLQPAPFGSLVTNCRWFNAEISGMKDTEKIFESFRLLGICGCACTTDFMVPADGKPRFLELNKLSATLADVSARTGASALDLYAKTNLSHHISPVVKVEMIELLLKNIEDIKSRFYSTPGFIAISPGSHPTAEFHPTF